MTVSALPKFDLTAALEKAEDWTMYQYADGTRRHGLYVPDSDAYDTDYSDAELAAIDTRLPALLTQLYSHCHTSDIAGIVRTTRDYWAGPVTVIPKGELITSYRIAAFHNLTHYPQHRILVVEMDVYSTSAMSATGVDYAYSRSRQAESIPESYLDTHFPSWKSRLLAAQVIELPDSELGRFLFSDSLVPTQPLPEADTMYIE